MANIGSFTIPIDFTIDNNKLTVGLGKAQQDIGRFSQTTERHLNATSNGFSKVSQGAAFVGGNFKMLGAALAAVPFIGFISSAINTANRIQEISDATGVAVPNLLQYDKAFRLAGGSSDSLSTAFGRLLQNIDAAKQSSKDSQILFERLGVSLDDLAKLEPQAIFEQVAQALAKMPKGEAAALGMDIFGKTMRNIDWNGFVSGSREVSASSEETALNIKKVNEIIDKLDATFFETQLKFITAIGPILEKTNEWLSDTENVNKVMEGLNTTFTVIAATCKGLYNAFDFIFKVLKAIGDTIIDLIPGFREFLELAGRAIGMRMSTPPPSASEAQRTAVGKIGGGRVGNMAAMEQAKGEFRGQNDAAIIADINAIGDKREREAALAAFKRQRELEGKPMGGGISADLGKTASQLAANPLIKAQENLDKVKEGYDKTAGAAVEAGKKTEESTKRIVHWSEQQKLQINGIVEGYRDSNQKAIERIRLETQLIGKGDDQKEMQLALADATKQYNDQLKSLEERLAAAKLVPDNEAIVRAYADAINEVKIAYKDYADELEKSVALKQQEEELDRQREFSSKVRLDTEQRIKDIQDEMRQATMTSSQKSLDDINIAARKSAEAQIELEQRRLGKDRQLSEERKAAIRKEYETSANAQREAQQKNIDYQRSFSVGWQKAFNEYADDATNSAKKAGQLFTKITQGMEDSIVSFAKTGKFGFKEFASSVIEDILRMEARALSTKILGGANQMFGLGVGNGGGGGGGAALMPGEVGGMPQGGGGGGGGGFLGGIGSALGGLVGGIGKMFGGFFADGGIIPAGKYGIVGERGPEYVSGPARITPMGNSNVTYNINAVDASSFKALVAADPGFIHAVAQMGANTVPGRR